MKDVHFYIQGQNLWTITNYFGVDPEFVLTGLFTAFKNLVFWCSIKFLKQKKMRNIYTIFCVGLLFLTSCEELIEVDAPTNQIGSTQVFEDLNTANAAMAYLYASLRDYSVISGTSNGAGALLGITLMTWIAILKTRNGYLDIFQNQQLETNSKNISLWKEAFSEIYYANSIISGIEHSASLTEVNKNQIKGEALLIRSLIYFYLQQIFGDIPYTTSLNYEYNRTISKTNGSALLEQLETDLTESAKLLKDDYRNSERIYPNRKVAQLLLAKIYLTEYKYTKAEIMADSVLQSPLYEFQLISMRYFTNQASIFYGN